MRIVRILVLCVKFWVYFAVLCSLAVSQSRGCWLGSTAEPSILLQKQGKNTSWHSENEEWNTLASVRHMRGPALHLPPQIWGNWSVRKALWGF